MNQKPPSNLNRPFWIMTSFTLMMAFSQSHAEQVLKPGTPLFFETKTSKGHEARIRVKDNSTGKNASLLLSPSENNTEIANGYYSLYFGGAGVNIEQLEFYENNQKLVLFSPGPNKENVYRVFLFKNKQDKEQFAQKFSNEGGHDYYPGEIKDGKSIVSDSDIPAVKPTAPVLPTPTPAPPITEIPKEIPKVAVLKEKSEDIQKRENEAKLNIEAQEALKRAARLEELSKMKEQEKKERKAQAQKIADKALMHYQKGEYKEAVPLFAEATTLDPESDQFYFQYGVALYKVDNYKKSLAILSISEGQTNQTELTYFKALNHMKLQEYDQALEEFTAVKEENDENLSGTAAFFAGSIAFRKEKYADARPMLEYALDKSTDPKIDEQAEDLLEEIDRIEAFLNRAKEIFRYTFTGGAGYDQNVLNLATQNLATNSDAVRFNYGGSFLYRFLYDYRNELSGEINLNDTYSLSSKFKPDSTIQAADPLVLSFGLPYRRQSLIGKRSVSWGVNPQFQSISMSLDGGARKQILSSVLTKLDTNFMLNAQWMSSYRFEYSSDTSNIAASSADDNQSGTKMTLGTTQTNLLDQRGTNTWNYNADYTSNVTKGKNYINTKLALGVGYTKKVFNDYDGSLKVDYSSQAYAQATTPRTDSLIVLTAGAGKEYWPSTFVNYSFQYNLNNSNLSTYQYNKFVLNASLTYMGSKKRQ